MKEGSETFCKLSNPVKVGDGINAYVTYEVTTNRLGSTQSVVRRYSDFSWLHDMLKEEFKNILIPPLPEKVIFDRFTPELVEYRRNELERFLKRILEHPQLSISPSVNIFLSVCDGEIDIEKFKPKSTSEKLPSKKEETKNFFASLTAGFTSVTSTGEVKEIDPWFATEKSYLTSLEVGLDGWATKSIANIKKNQELVTTINDLGQSVSQMNRCEQSQNDNDLAILWGKFSEILYQIALLTEEHVVTEIQSFLYPMKDYVRIVGACQSLVANREARLLELQMCKAETAFKTDKHVKSQGTPRANALAIELQTAKDLEYETERSFQLFSEGIKSELETFHIQKRKNLHQTLCDLVNLYISHLLRIINLWKELLKIIEGQQE